MRFASFTASGVDRNSTGYQEYLESIKERLPSKARSFVTCDWYYDPTDHRCPHDSWVETLTVSEPALGERKEVRSLCLTVQLLGAYHDGHVEFVYDRVTAYSIEMPKSNRAAQNQGHGDWLFDEIMLMEDGTVQHEVVFSLGGSWLIQSNDISHAWVPFRR